MQLTARQLRAVHRRRSAAKRGQEPGLAETLLDLLRDPAHGPLNLKKLELADELLALALREIEKGARHSIETRPIVRFVYTRIAQPLANESWR